MGGQVISVVENKCCLEERNNGWHLMTEKDVLEVFY